MNIKSLFTLSFVLILLSAQGQDSKKTVILYNVVPLSVELLKDGTIKSIYGKADHYFKGYQIVKRESSFSENADNQNFASINNDVVVSTDITRLIFDNQLAVLNQGTIAGLDKIKQDLFLNPSKKIMLTSYTIDQSNKRESILLQNRLASCLSYLEIMGVSKDRIVLDSNTQTSVSGAILAVEIVNENLVNSQF